MEVNKFTDYYRIGGIGGIKSGNRQFNSDIQRSICVNLDKKLIFYKPGKCAGTSMYRRVLEPRGGWMHQKDYGKKFSDWMDQITDKEWEGYFSFIFVRNPFARLVSCWNTIARHIPFKEYVKSGIIVNDVPKILHYQTQCSLLETPDLSYKTNVDFIGKVENIDEDWKKLCSITGISYTPLPRAKSNGGRGGTYPNYTTFYDDESREIVEKMYARDLEMFNYKF